MIAKKIGRDMKKQSGVYVVFKTDAWLSVCSYELMGVFGTMEKAIRAIMEHGEFDDEWIELHGGYALSYIRGYLGEHLQTPNCGAINYIIKEGNLNEWEQLL